MAEHKLKCWPSYFEAIERGDKNFEVRRDDRGFQRGDTLILQKFDPEKHKYEMDGFTFSAKPIELRRTILYVLTGGQFGIQSGHVVMALAPAAPEQEPRR